MDDVMERLQKLAALVESMPGRQASMSVRGEVEFDVDAASLPLYGRPETVTREGTQWDRVRITVGTVPMIICGPFRAAPKE